VVGSTFFVIYPPWGQNMFHFHLIKISDRIFFIACNILRKLLERCCHESARIPLKQVSKCFLTFAAEVEIS
jgi:hypothetical protein